MPRCVEMGFSNIMQLDLYHILKHKELFTNAATDLLLQGSFGDAGRKSLEFFFLYII